MSMDAGGTWSRDRAGANEDTYLLLVISTGDVLSTYLQSTVEQAVPIIFFDFMVVHDTSPKFSPFLTQLNCTEARHCTPVETLFNNTVLLTHAPFCSIAFLPNVAIESN